ncbi:hypothetical protein [Flavobacterium sp. 3HN19-14]|uniref:hypothetical protein n=1 Tax=Flavobacterium sp. 3HN19-14 TaxID=3448133 RepID=UPI003EE15D17
MLQYENCTPKPTALAATPGLNVNADPTPDEYYADLSWTSNEFNAWQVAVQDAGQPVPNGLGTYTYVTSPNYHASPLLAAHQYQYWVRAECSPGSNIYTAWAGPFLFNTPICAPEFQCTHTFRLRNTAAGGWHNGRMEVRQNGITIATLGSTLTGTGQSDVPVTLCSTVPYEVFWTVAGTSPQQMILEVLNSFGQTIYTKPAGTGTPGSSIITGEVNCTTPRCDIPPTNVTVNTITTTGATIQWVAPATETYGWDIYVVPAGSPAPTESTTPTYDNVTSITPTSPFSFATTIPLQPDHSYDVYVRVNCTPVPSALV